MKHLYYSIAIIFFLLFCGQAKAQNIMKLGDVSVQAGQEATLTVSIDNALPFVAFQVDIPIPSGLTYVESSAFLDDTRKDGHTLSASIIAPNTLRLIGYSLTSLPFKGASGTVMSFKLKAGVLPGNYLLTLTNPIIGDATSANIMTSSVNGTVKILSPHIQLSVASIDFSRVALLQTSDRSVTITNTGNQALNVTGITFTNPQFTAIGGSSFTLDQNGTKNITVRFTSTTKGTYKETMSVASNDPALPTAIDTLKAVAFAVNEIHAGNITALSGQTKTLDFTINNMEPFTAFQFDIPLPTTMQYVAGSAALLRKTDHVVSCNLLTGNILRVVAFSASNTAFTGTSGKVLSLDFKIAGQSGWYPINVNNGIISDAAGLNAMSASYNGQLQVSAPQISTAQSLAFGDVSILGSKSLNLKVYNYGGDVLNIDQLIFSDPSFSSTQTLPLSIAIGQNKDIPVVFSKSSKGTVSATLKINSNDPVTNPFTVNLSANAYAPNYINVKDFNGVIGSKVVVAIDVDNEEDFVALQCDLKYPSYLVPDSTGIVLTDRKVDHSVQSNRLGNNTIRLVAFSLNQQVFKGKSGAVINIPFTISAGAVVGSYPLEISNGILGNAASQNILWGTRNGTFTINGSVGSAGVITGNTSVCKGGTETYTVPVITGATSYIWALPTGITGTSSTNSITTTISSTAISGSIKVKGHNTSGDGPESTLAITVNDIPSAAGTISWNITVCQGGSETYTVPAIAGATSYVWTLPTGITGTSSTNSITVTIGSTAVSGSIKVKGHNNCGDGSESILVITVNKLPSAAGTITGNASVCKGGSETYTVPAITGATSYVWTLPTGLTGTSTTNSIAVTIGTTAISGSIKVKGHNSCGDGTESALAITVNDIPSASGVISGSIVSYRGTSETYTVPAITGATSYIWTLPTGVTGSSTTNSITMTISASAVSGSIKVKGHNNCGDGTESTLAITFNDIQAASAITGSNTVCKGGAETYSVGAIGGATSYIWTLPTGFTGTSTTNSITVTIGTSAVSSSIKVKGHNSIGDGTESTLVITVNDVPPAASTIVGNATVCKGGSEIYTVPAITGATSYVWTLPTGLTGTSITNTITLTIATTAVSGNIKVKGHNNCGDGTESSLAFTVNDIPSAAGTIAGNTTAYKGTYETYTVPAITGATSYIWTLPTGVTGTSTTNSISATISSIAVSGNIKVKGHNSCGDGTEGSLAITISDVTAGVITGNTSVCKGGTETYTVGTIAGATSYIWTLPTGATGTSSTNTISVTFSSTAVSGSIKVKGHNSGGDGTESSLALTVNDVPSAAGVITGNVAVCKGGTETYTVPSITGATSYVWTLPTGLTGTSTTNTISFTVGTTAASGSIKVKGHNGCGDGTESTLALTVNDIPSAAGTISGNTTTYRGTTETYTVPAITGATSYIWALPTGVTGTSTTNSITATISATGVSGNIKVKGHNSCGDGGEVSLAITVNDVIAGVITGNTSVCKGGTETYTVSAIVGATSYIWTLPTGATGTSSTNTISVTFSSTAVSGSIKVKGHNSGGDGTESSLALTVNDIPSAAGTISGNTTTYRGTTETYTVPAITEATSYIWTLPTGVTGTSTTNSITATISATGVSGNIKVKGHNSCGDGTESSLVITVNDAGKSYLTVKGVTACSGTDVMVTLDVDNGMPFIALQCDLKYPDYLTPKTSNIVLTNRATDHNIQSSLPAANTLRVLAYSLTLQAFKGNTGSVVQIPFTISSNAVAGSYPLELSNVTLGNSQSQNILDNAYNGTMVVNTPPSAAGIITGNTNICSQTTNIVYTIPVIAGASSYIWTLPTGANGTSTTNSISLTYGSGSASGNLKVKGHNDCGDGSEASLAITVCLGVGIEDNSISNKIEVFPNPTKDLFYVTINKPFNYDFKVEICNSFGQVLQTILKQQRDNKFSVDLANFPKGIYVIRFSDKETYYNSKIVKQ